MKIKRPFLLVLAILWMGVIFVKSDKTADASSAESAGVIRILAGMLEPGFEELSEEEKQAVVDRFDHPVRKAAHMMEYAILASLLFGAFYDKRLREAFFIAWGAAVLYAASDEFHQTFVAGRSGEVKDVCIDAIGALLGLVLIVLLKKNTKALKASHFL